MPWWRLFSQANRDVCVNQPPVNSPTHPCLQAVLSGDTIVVVGKAVGQAPPQEVTLTLASIQAPRISRGPSQNVEEPYGWESREMLRTYCIGKQATFRINRTFADVEMVGAGETSSGKLMVEAGLATVTPAVGDGKVSTYYDDLVVLEEEAKEGFRGVHSGKGPPGDVRKINWSPTQEQIEDIFNKHKGKPVSVIVVRVLRMDLYCCAPSQRTSIVVAKEHVRDGSSLRVLVLESMTYLSFSLAGILSPRIVKHKDDGSGRLSPTRAAVSTSSFNLASSDPYALQARHFIELRLMNREVEGAVPGPGPRDQRAGHGAAPPPKATSPSRSSRWGWRACTTASWAP